ncbi:MAG: hypothetical protein HZA17_10895 [Nitrospirae bacterium]|nr:hypothetical protein [Nitrospirota bacterium]
MSVLPDSTYGNGGAPVSVGQGNVTVFVQPFPIPTAQISVFAFVDQNPINNLWDEGEQGLGDARVYISDQLGEVSQDVFGNPLGTRYNSDGSVSVLGTGTIKTLTKRDFDNGNNPDNIKVGEALIKNIAPGKYGILVVPPQFDDNLLPIPNRSIQWIQTTTIEGTPTIDAWVKANEPNIFVEGFGTGFNHAFFGYIKVSPLDPVLVKGQTIESLPWNVTPSIGSGSIEGTLRFNHFAQPPNNQGYFAGEPVGECWVGLNNPIVAREAPAPAGAPGEVFNKAGLYAAPCDANSHFVINNVPPGTYQLVTWDKPLDSLFGFNTVTVGRNQHINLGDILIMRWFGTWEGTVFYDMNQNGFRDPGEQGLINQNLNLRFRDGSIYQAQVTDVTGEYQFSEVFPFFKWLITEVDYTRYKPTGITAAVDYGGQIPPANGWIVPSFGKLNPQPQAEINPNTGNNLSRTETGPALLEAMHLFLNQTNVIDWGKIDYAQGENGGIAGIVFYATTRAESDPRYAAGDPWEPGIPRVQVALYKDFNADGIIDDINGVPGIQMPDVDNHPFGWLEGTSAKGPEDVVRCGDGITFCPGDAMTVSRTDSWDDNMPSGCIQNLPIIHGQPSGECADAYGTWNQVRPGLFDGGYAFGSLVGDNLEPGTYIVEAVPPPGYELQKEEDRNVFFGGENLPSPLLISPPCVGDPHAVPQYLALFPDQQLPVSGWFPGMQTPLCNRKQVIVQQGQNTAADFHLFTDVPKAARAVGFANNDLGAEFNMASPNFGEKLAPAWIPISFKDWTGKEITRVYSDEFGGYNALLPSSYSVNVPTPTGVSPNMITLILNDPVMPDGSLDPFYNPTYSVTPWTFQYFPGTTTYLDTPLVPMAAFATAGVGIDTEPTASTPVIKAVNGPETGGGPLLCSTRSNGSTIIITSTGPTVIINPDYVPGQLGNPFKITRNYGFGNVVGGVTVNGAPLNIVSWADDTIVATVPAGVTTGQLMVTRGDSGFTTEVGVNLNIINCVTTRVVHVPGDFSSIQAAIDDPATRPGTFIMVAPGTYTENVIMNKPVRLQGAGAGSTFINGNPDPLERIQLWHDRINALGGAEFEAFLLKRPFFENETPGIIVIGELAYPNGTVMNQLEGTKTLNPGHPFSNAGQAAIDGFTIAGSKGGSGIFAVAGTKYLMVSNNIITNNQGRYGGGIVIGTQDNGFDSQNHNVTISKNKVHRNGGIQGPGGIAMNEYANDYLVEENLVVGNFSRFHGGGIQHRGLSPGNNVIRKNRILFNEDHFGALLAKAGDGGGIHIGGDVAGGTGSGNVTIDGNLIQGNLTGSGYGGGIRAFAVNGQDVLLSPDSDASWYRLNIFNNIIVNNVAALAGGGISLQDVVRATIMNNTIANNDSTATSRNAFTAGQPDSAPQPAGIDSHIHSDALRLLFGVGYAAQEVYSNPVLRNNVIWHNRSFYNDHTLNNGAGGLAPNPTNPYWDLQVTGVSGTLNPQYCLLTDTAGYAATNIAADPAFRSGYSNSLTSATVIDEGGNNINVRYTPTIPNSGDYHITTSSAALGTGSMASPFGQHAELTKDYDGDARPRPVRRIDIGADQLPAGPQNFRFTFNGNLLTISWSPVANANGYRIGLGTHSGQYDGVYDVGNVTQVGPIDMTCVAPGTFYLVVQEYGSMFSNEIAVVWNPPAGTLLTPANFRYSLSGTLLTINWDASCGAGGYRIGLGTQTGNYAGVFDVGNITQIGPADISGIGPGTYYLAIRAYNSAQQSGYSPEISIPWNPGKSTSGALKAIGGLERIFGR